MSWCRWSSLDFQCDLYVYDAEDGVTVVVAGNRVVLAEPVPTRLPTMPSGDDKEGAAEWANRAAARMMEVQRIVSQSEERVPIGLSRDGQHYDGMSLDEAADLVDSLVDEGYLAPDGLADDLREAAGASGLAYLKRVTSPRNLSAADQDVLRNLLGDGLPNGSGPAR